MRVSKNELTATLKRALEGVGFSIGEYEDTAHMAVWLEMHGLGGLQELQRGLPYLTGSAPAAELVFEERNLAVVNAHGNNSVVCGSLAIDLAYSKAKASGFASVKLNNSHNRKLLIKSLVDCARRGMNCLAYWTNASNPARQHVVAIQAQASYPTYLEYDLKGNERAADKQSINIVCSAQAALLPSYASVQLARQQAHVKVITPQQMADHYAEALEHGIELDAAVWQQLNKMAESVLVEATEASRARGAGDSAS